LRLILHSGWMGGRHRWQASSHSFGGVLKNLCLCAKPCRSEPARDGGGAVDVVLDVLASSLASQLPQFRRCAQKSVSVRKVL
jgi:hypothetical protein